jgi:hypothetical protein
MALKAAFIFLSPGADPSAHRAHLATTDVELTVVGVENYAQAERVARGLVEEGIVAIELCGGFGNEGTARVARLVRGKAAVGAVRFDCHPGLEGKSGDLLFG